MWEFDIYNSVTKKYDTVWGYDVDDAFRRNPTLDPNDWEVVHSVFID